MWAALGGHSEIISYLLGADLKKDIPPSSISYGKPIDVFKTTRSGMNVLHGIVYNGSLKCLSAVFDCDRIKEEEMEGLERENQKIDLGVISGNGRESKARAGKDNRSSEVQKREATPSLSTTIITLCNQRDEDGKTPYEIAAESFKFDICDCLIINGDPFAVEKNRENEKTSSFIFCPSIISNIIESIQNLNCCSCLNDNFQEGEVEMPSSKGGGKGYGGTSL